jgi:trehalose 6-phosphate synthase/phosphatase
MSSMIVVSNRLPITITKDLDSFTYTQSIGGLATGLFSYTQQKNITWVGWPGIEKDNLTVKQQSLIKETLLKEYQYTPVFLSKKLIKGYYHGFSNKTLWPLCHYFIEKTQQNEEEWLSYVEANQLFYASLKPLLTKESVVWIHDYQLLLLPAMIRKDFPYIKIGYFHHIPFPSYELFRLLIHKKELLYGLLGADLIGFHTYDYVRHFLSSIRRILLLDQHLYTLNYEQRIIEVNAFPMGIDYAFFAKKRKLNRLPISQILSVDRLDYSKGILERLDGYEQFLTLFPKHHQHLRLQLIVAPSREKMASYDQLKESIEKKVSQINGKFGNAFWMPIWYLYQSFSQEALIELYHQSDILLVTPLRDGMNLIAKEYLATRQDGLGTLIISETAGASSELSEAILVNPNDINDIAQAINTALSLSPLEKKRRSAIILQRLKRYDVHYWAKMFLTRLTRTVELPAELAKDIPFSLPMLKDKFYLAKRRLIILDYDGTLMPLQATPEQGKPTIQILTLLHDLAHIKDTDVAIISGRDYRDLDLWFENMPLLLSGDHGMRYRLINQPWQTMIEPNNEWKPAFKKLLHQFLDQMPGSVIEEKKYSIAFHFRQCEPDMVAMKRIELMDALHTIKGNSHVEIQLGHMMVEIKDASINKGQAALLFAASQPYDFIFIAGDDLTDESMFKAIPNAVTFKIGEGQTLAQHRLFHLADLTTILKALIRLDS